ncbi:MAG: putative bifunctional diguanylate cyclase/phosphodiesterase [Marinomonas sp.]
MAVISELQSDKYFRWQLIFACLGVAILVSTIYVVVSYRLSADLGMRLELASLEKQTLLLHAELIEADNEADERMTELMHLIHINEPDDAVFSVSIQGPYLDWSLNQNISEQDINEINKLMSTQANTHLSNEISKSNGIKTIGKNSYLWQEIKGNGYQVQFYHLASSLETTLDYIAKRLSITSFIVIWIAIWCALTLTFWMSKRVEGKNNALIRLATHDPLTGLPNRLYLVDMMQKALPDIEGKNPITQASLFVVDLDKFKEVNDTLGHSAGDQLLKKVALRLSSVLTPEQTLFRTGGDEFLIWAPHFTQNQAANLAATLVHVCEEAIIINQLSVNTGASIGIAHYPLHGTDTDTLIANADNAMYEAKQQHCGWVTFNEKEATDGHQRLRLRADLNDAFNQHQIKFYYQTKVNLKTGEITGVEALARWYHPDDGILSPFYFIDLIEQSGRVQEFGRYVIHNTIIQLADWKQQGIHIPIAINLSPYNLLDPGLIDFIWDLLTSYGVSPKLLEIELTESVTSLNIQSISHKLEDLKSIGIKLAIDDFGTGMSSLSYISNLNADIIKIDRAFIVDIESNDKHKAIVATIIALANVIGSSIVAEGIENEEQADLLTQMGCCYGQGYYYSRPVQTATMTKMLKAFPVITQLENDAN